MLEMHNIHEKVYACLVNSNANSFPINVFSLKVNDIDWIILSKSEVKREKLFNYKAISDTVEEYKGFAVALMGGSFLIVYDETLSSEERDITIAHEIGHIILGHIRTSDGISVIGRYEDANTQEEEAESFALALLAPPCLLAHKGLFKPRTISRITCLSENKACRAAVEISSFLELQKTPLDKALLRKFRIGVHWRLIRKIQHFIYWL